MLKDYSYNLMETITVISQSLARYDTYMKDAAQCGECQEIWKKLKEERERDLSMLLSELD